MPKTQGQEIVPLIPAGEHVLTLVIVEEVTQEDRFHPGQQVTQFFWKFKSNQKDEETGERFQYTHYTKTKYGNEKANLTILLDMMFPDMDDAEKKDLDTDDYNNTKWSATIRHAKNEKGDPKPVLVFIRPYVPKAKPAPANATPAEKKAAQKAIEDEDEEIDPDPFASDDDE